jgi:hypothetical protein
MKFLTALLIVILVSCSSKLPKSKEVAIFADKIEIAITEESDGLKFKTTDGTELYRHSPLKAGELIGYIKQTLEAEKKFKNNRRHKIDEKKVFYKESGVLISYNYTHKNKTSVILLCFRPENKGKDASPICEGMEAWKAKRLIEPLSDWKRIKKQLD